MEKERSIWVREYSDGRLSKFNDDAASAVLQDIRGYKMVEFREVKREEDNDGDQ